MSAPVVRRWRSLGLIPEPPWTGQQLHQVRDETDPQGSRHGSRAAHGLPSCMGSLTTASFMLFQAKVCLPRPCEGDLLVLSTKPMTFQGVTRSAELVWERVGRD
jgi:hypothetical protein